MELQPSLIPFCTKEYTASSSVWLLRLMTVSLDGFIGGRCDFWSCENFLCFLALLSSPTCVAFSKVSWSISNQSGLDTKFSRCRCTFSNPWDVLSSSQLSWWSSSCCAQLYNNIYYVYNLDTTFFYITGFGLKRPSSGLTHF